MSFPEYVHLFKAKMVFESITSAFREMTINSRRGVRFKHDAFRVSRQQIVIRQVMDIVEVSVTV